MDNLREALISSFSDGKNPTGSQFRLLIESIMSRRDDGMDKTVDTPLKIMAGKDIHAPVISLCPKGVLDPQWVLSLKALDSEGAVIGEGLNLGQGDKPSNPVVFIDKATGHVGLGTNVPTGVLEVQEPVNGETAIVLHNPSEGAAAYVIHRLRTLGGDGVIFRNSSARTADGGPNAMTVRNDAGDLRLQATLQKAIIALKSTTGFVGINTEAPTTPLEINGHTNLNGSSLYFPNAQTRVNNVGAAGIFWHGASFGNEPLQHGIYKTDGPWTQGVFQQLRLQFTTGIQLGAGTGTNDGYAKSYVEIINGKGLMVTSGNLGVGTAAPLAKAQVVTVPFDGDQPLPPAWNTGQLVVGGDANAGGVGIGYHGGKETGYLISAAPGGGYKDLTVKARTTVFSNGTAETMRLLVDGRVGIGTNNPSGLVHLRRDNNAVTATYLQNAHAGAEAFVCMVLQTDNGAGFLFKNSSTRTADGGISTMTLRNDKGDLRLQGESSYGMFIKAMSGNVGIGTNVPANILHIRRDQNTGTYHLLTNAIAGVDAHVGTIWQTDFGQGVIFKNSTTRAADGGVNTMTVRNDTGDLRVQAQGAVGLHVKAIDGFVGINTVGLAGLSIGTANGKKENPDGSMHITNDTIVFGGGNGGGKETNSAQITAGRHQANALCIVGMSSGNSSADRRLDIWSDGGMNLRAGNLGIGTAGLVPAALSIYRSGGKVINADTGMHITNDSILFGGVNNGRVGDSAQITVGRHIANSLNIVGMSDASNANRRVDMWAEGGLNVYGKIGINTRNAQHVLQVNGGNLAFYPSDEAGYQNANGHSFGSIYFYGHGRPIGNDSARITSGSTAWDDVGYLAFHTSNDANASVERMRIDAAGNLGLGITTPEHFFHARRDLNGGVYKIIQNASNGADAFTLMGIRTDNSYGFIFKNSSTRSADGGVNTMTMRNDQGDTRVQSQGGNGIVIRATTGNTGIGTSNPLGKLDVAGGPMLLNSGITNSTARPAVTKDRIAGEFGSYSSQGITADDGFMRISAGAGTNANTKSFIDLSGYHTQADMDRNIIFGTTGVERVRIDNGGNVGIGTKTPYAGLSINANGKEEWPDACMHITNDCILFGGNNSGREVNSGQIAAGKHVPNSLNILGMTATQNYMERRIDMWAEGGLNVYGKIGIGMSSATYPLQIASSVAGNIPSYGYLSRGGAGTYGGAVVGVGIWSAGRIVCDEFNAISDERTKENISQCNGAEDLALLQKIEVANYTYRDYVAKGAAQRKGVIAQQIEQIYPEAIAKHSDYVPDIYASPKSIGLDEGKLSLTMEKPHGLKTGDEVRIFSKNGYAHKPVKVKNKTTFSINEWEYDTDGMFVFGRRVEDFMVVDYNRIFTVAVSATQELARQVETLKAQNESLLGEVAAIKKALAQAGIQL
jgi:hypothetical protein